MDTDKKKIIINTGWGTTRSKHVKNQQRFAENVSPAKTLMAAAETDPLTSLATGHFLYALIHPGTTVHIISFHFPAMED